MAAMIREGCYVDAICGGNGRCGKCKVRVLSGDAIPSNQDKAFFTEEELEQGWRLSCTLYPMDDLVVEYASEKDKAFEMVTEFRGGSKKGDAAGAGIGKVSSAADAENVNINP